MFSHGYRRFGSLLLLFTLPFLVAVLLPPSIAHADGGAPNLAYVSGTSKGVSVVDVQQQKITGTISVPGNPDTVSLSLDGRFLYVTQPQLNKVSIVAAKTGEIICSADVSGQPTLLVFDSNVNALYAGGSGASSVTVLDATNCKVKRVIQTAGPVFGLAFAAIGTSVSAGTGDQLWVANPSSIGIFDDISGKGLGTVLLPEGPRYLSIPPGATVYAATAKGTVVAIDLNAPYTVTSLLSGGDYGPMDYDATTGEVYVPDQKNNEFVVLTPMNAGFKAPKEPNRVIKVTARPVSIAITNDGQLGFGALDNGSVVLYDIPGRQIITTIQTGGSPRFVISGVYPPTFGTTPQQASLFEQAANIAGYLIVVALLVVPILLFRRYARRRDPKEGEKNA
jgi:DNA-binding beta-propeller fold protein YncE